MKKHNFTPGTGMTIENSTAEERKEIWQLLIEHGYKFNDIDEIDHLDGFGFILYSDKRWHASNLKVTNPLTYAQMKVLILGDTSKMPFKAACEAIKHGTHQIENDVPTPDKIKLLKELLKESFPYDSIFNSGLNYYQLASHAYGKFWTHAKTAEKSGLPIIKLSEIMPKEVKLNPCALCTYETSSRGENALVQLCDYHNNGKVQFSFDVPVKSASFENKKEAHDKFYESIKRDLEFQIPTLTRKEAEEKLSVKIID